VKSYRSVLHSPPGPWLHGLLAVLLICEVAAAQELPRIAANDNQVAGGILDGGVLRIRLEIREGLWFPEAEDGRSVVVQAFAEQGRPLQIPGPMLRVPQGTQIVATVRNRLREATAQVQGLQTRPAEKLEPIAIPAGESREFRFRADVPGTYHYWASTTGGAMGQRLNVDAHLSGALIVDAPGAPTDDRVFVIGHWRRRAAPNAAGFSAVEAQMLSVNGKAWPYSERLTYQAGEAVRWRWINTTVGPHAMHLHGSYYRVDSEGDGNRDTIYAETDRRLVVTEHMNGGETITTTWIPERSGRWVFHCHMLEHMSPEQSLVGLGKENHAHHGDSRLGYASGMKGLVMGITVLPGTEAVAANASPGVPRRFRLLVRERPATWTDPRAHVFQLQDGDGEPPVDEATVPGPILLLERGEPTEITVVNQLADETAVHWHGIELESYYDGVPGWGGHSAQVTPPIAPGRSFVARMTPPRAGTFIYHTHWHDELQLTTGMYGALIVVDPGSPFDPETDKVFVIGGGGADDAGPVLLNGVAQPRIMRLRAGLKYRFRFINITTNATGIRVALREDGGDGSLLNWRAVAKDGADLPASQALMRPADQLVAVGETYDFEFQHDGPGEVRLELTRRFRRMTMTQALFFEEPRK
jgi:FtsP/CotA-like multicopper oxidase with cupredoxin domain